MVISNAICDLMGGDSKFFFLFKQAHDSGVMISNIIGDDPTLLLPFQVCALVYYSGAGTD